MKRTLGLLIGIALTSVAAARDIYVDNVTGDDRRHGTVAQTQNDGDGPVGSLAKALRLAGPGDRIVLAVNDEPYRESVVLFGGKHSGSPVSPFVIEGNGATFDGSELVPDDAWSHEVGDIFSFQPEELGTQRLFVDGRLAVQVPMDRGALRLPTLEPLQWCFSGQKIFLRVEPGKPPTSYALASTHLTTAIVLDHVSDVVVRDLHIQGYHHDGIGARDVVRGARLERVHAWANARSGVSVGGASRVALFGCELTDNGEWQLRSRPYSHVWLAECPLDPQTPRAIELLGEVLLDGKSLSAP